MALKAIRNHAESVFRYPEILHQELIEKIAVKNSVKPENVVVSAGSVALMDISIKSFVGFDENVITAAITFPGYRVMAKINKRSCKLAPLVDNAINLPNMLSLCDDKTRIVFIANPNNPTGTMIAHHDLEEFLSEIPSEVYVVSDEAYAEYVTDRDYPDTQGLQNTFPNLIIFHSFSKMYGLAGLRIGYAIAHPDVALSLVQHKTPFSINSLATVAASAALDDTDYIKECAEANARERLYLYNELKNHGCEPVFPHANFVFVEFNEPDEVEKVSNILKDQGILVRPLGPFGAERAMRITVGRPEENRRLIKCLMIENRRLTT